MKNLRLLAFVCLLFCFACKPDNNNHKTWQTAGIEKDIHIKDSLVKVDLGDGIMVSWNRYTSGIQEDSAFAYTKANIERLKFMLVEKIRDTTLTDIKICDFRENLKKGDLAYLLLERTLDGGIPFFVVFHMQLDVYECSPYPIGFFDYIDDNRGMVSEKVLEYLHRPDLKAWGYDSAP